MADFERYVPGNIYDFKDVADELQRVAAMLSNIADGRRDIYFSEPTKPSEGMLVFADGTKWNPGSGAGTYERRAGAWTKL